jgi:lipopolysaccharide/colanic/teichoic acid biosynthesis glycosyltransferase
MLRMDMEYLQRRSLTFDFLLLFRTAMAVLKADGAR